MKWDTFIEKYKIQENFDRQIDFLKLYYSNFILWKLIKKHFYEFWECTKFETLVDYRIFLYMITGNPTMYKVLQKYLYLILLDTKDYQLDCVIKLLMDAGVEIKIDDQFEEFLNNYLTNHEYEDNCKLIKVLDLNERVEKYTRFLIQEQLNRIVEFNDAWAFSGYSKDIYSQMIDRLIYDLKVIARNDGVENTIHYINGGCYTKVFQIGKYVLKIGRNKFYSIDSNINSSYLIQPVFYKEFLANNLCIEIMPYVDLNHVTKEDSYEMYSKNRDEGFLWVDPKPQNMGILLYDTENLFPDSTPLGRKFLGIWPFKVQKTGQKVIIDLDFYFDFRRLSLKEREEQIRIYLQKYFDGWNVFYEEQYQQQKQKVKK